MELCLQAPFSPLRFGACVREQIVILFTSQEKLVLQRLSSKKDVNTCPKFYKTQDHCNAIWGQAMFWTCL